jgi:signal transduction histidine kinase
MLEYFQHEETLQMTLNSGPDKLLHDKVPQVLQQLKLWSQLDPERAPKYYAQFNDWIEIQKSLVEWDNLKPIIEMRMQQTSLMNALILTVLTLIISFFVAKSVTLQFQKLLEEKKLSAKRQVELKSLIQWQTTARNLVHELRGPLTPIKLVTSSLAEDAEKGIFDVLQREGIQLSLQKIQQMENMIQKFMTFAKLPEAHLTRQSLSEVLKSFIEHYADSFRKTLRIEPLETLTGEPLLWLDEALIHNACFALLQNASEAVMVGGSSQVYFQLGKERCYLTLSVFNTGTVIPHDVEANLFQVGSSSKLTQSKNFGIGLAMAKKIMLDHGGDLILASNSLERGVCFKFLFPLKLKSWSPETSRWSETNIGNEARA